MLELNKKILGVLLLIVFAVAGCGKQADLVVSGTIEAKEVNVSCETGGIVKGVLVGEGTQVKAGEVLATLDTSILQLQLDQAKANLAMADARAREVVAGSREQQISSAKGNLDQVKAMASGAQNNVTALTNVLKETRDKSDELKSATGYSANPNLQQQVMNLEVAERNLVVQLEAANSQIGASQAQVRVAQAQYELVSAGATTQAKEGALAQVDQARVAVKLAEAQLAKTEVKAPVDGVVTVLGLKAGELASPGLNLARIAVVKELTLTVYVPENQLAKAQVGQTVKFKVDAYPGEEFSGKIKKINTQAEFTPKNVQTPSERVNMVFGVTIEVAGNQERLKPGMPADVTL